ncbi:hypothetical protein niasHS_000495 [Heterodera schachtii]|uniref:Uncharacterized protein n=1 Tax=Heterodera schachtii TaxID=97005 RepID=A0ABD2K4E3_HETSC
MKGNRHHQRWALAERERERKGVADLQQRNSTPFLVEGNPNSKRPHEPANDDDHHDDDDLLYTFDCQSKSTNGKCWHGQSPGDTEGSVIPSLWRTVGFVSIPVDIPYLPPAPFIRPSVRSNDWSLSVREDKQTDGEKRHLINGPIPLPGRFLALISQKFLAENSPPKCAGDN